MTQEYYGTKKIKAEAMNRLEYNKFRGWTLPADENGEDEGYLVEYQDGGKPNIEGRAGYISWSPKEQFDNAYQPITSMSFGHAVEALKAGHRVARSGWNGKGMWLELVIDIHDVPQTGTNRPTYSLTGRDEFRPLLWIGMKTADNKFVPWLASQTDILANDWQIVE